MKPTRLIPVAMALLLVGCGGAQPAADATADENAAADCVAALTAAHRGAAKHDGGDGVHLHAGPKRGLHRGIAAGVDESGQCGHGAGGRIDKAADPLDPNTGKFSGFYIAAGGIHMPSQTGEVENHIGGDDDEDHIDDRPGDKAQGPAAEFKKGLVGQPEYIGRGDDIDGAAQNALHRVGDDKGR